jgi:protein gp37
VAKPARYRCSDEIRAVEGKASSALSCKGAPSKANMGQKKYANTTRISGGRAKWTGKVVLDERSLEIPKTWAKDRLIFVNSMSDLLHEVVPFHFIQRIFEVMEGTPQHTYQIKF